MKMFFKKNGINSIKGFQNLYQSIPRRTAAVLKAKGGPTAY
jgi:hypothetical protein